ncbi:MAG: hypothetical protein QW186_07695 [Candidatus Bathyarchaeia archaeon]
MEIFHAFSIILLVALILLILHFAKSINAFPAIEGEVKQFLPGLNYSWSLERGSPREVLRVPWATGLAITTFLLAVYSKRKPLAYAHVIDKMLTGSMPLSRHLIDMTEIALDLSEYLGNAEGRPLITHKSAKVISKMMVNLLNVLPL